MPPTEVVCCILLLTAICSAASSFLLRASCSLANYTVGPDRRMPIPSYWTALGALFVGSYFTGLLHSTTCSAISFFGVVLPENAAFHFVSTIGPLLLFAVFVAVVIRSGEDTSRSLALLASLVYVILFFGSAWCGGWLFFSE